MVKPDNRQLQRWLAVGLLALVILIAGLIVIVPLAGKYAELNETKDNLAHRLQQYVRILAKKDAVIENINTLRNQSQQGGLLNRQSTGALASAEVQEFIKKTVAEAGGELMSTQALPLSGDNEFSRITVSVRMTCNSEELRAVLYKLETAVPLIIIDQLEIRPERGIRNRFTNQLDPSNELNVNFQAVSFMRKQPA